MKKLITFLLISSVLLACSPAKRVAKYNEDVKRGIKAYMDANPCVNDTVVEESSDTSVDYNHWHEFVDNEPVNTDYYNPGYAIYSDSLGVLFYDSTSKGWYRVRETKETTITNKKTAVVSDQRVINYYKDSLSGLLRTNLQLKDDYTEKERKLLAEISASKKAEAQAKVDESKWEIKARTRLYLMIGIATVYTIIVFRKPIAKLLTFA